MEVRQILCKIFSSNYIHNKEKSSDITYVTELNDLETWISNFLKTESDYETEEKKIDSRHGRIGFRKVNLRIKTQYGTVIMNDARSNITSQSNLATVCGDCIVCDGKWQYEVQLQSRGTMRLGWLKYGQKCTRDKGVGDIFGSYGFDGNSKRFCVNGNVRVYGESWHTGDVIGVLIDFSLKSVSYYINGRNLGELPIDDIQFLYPAVTLSKFESAHINFGREPFHYPVSGYEPLQLPNLSRNKQIKYLCEWIDSILDLINPSNLKTMIGGVPLSTLINEIFRVIEVFFTNLVQDSYVIATAIIPFMHDLTTKNKTLFKFLNFMNFLWDYLNNDTLIYVLKSIFEQLRLSFRRSALNIDFYEQKVATRLIRDLLDHKPTRIFAIKYIIFDRCDFGYYFHVKPLDDICMTKEVPETWWEKKDLWMDKKKKAYDTSGKHMSDSLHEIEVLQNQIMSILIQNNDGNKFEPSSRALFLSELRDFAVIQKFSVHLGLNLDMPPPVALTVSFKLLELFEKGCIGVETKDIIPATVFFDDNISYEFCDRIGGQEDYLRSTLHRELAEVEISSRHEDSEPDEIAGEEAIVQVTTPILQTSILIRSSAIERGREEFAGSPFSNENVSNARMYTPPQVPPFSANIDDPRRIISMQRTGLSSIPEHGESSRQSGANNLLSTFRHTLNASTTGALTGARSMFSSLADTLHSHDLGIGGLLAPPLPTATENAEEVDEQRGSQQDDYVPIMGFQTLNRGSSVAPINHRSTIINSGPSHNPAPTTSRQNLNNRNSSDNGNDFILVALRDIIPVRILPSGVDIMREMNKLPIGREYGVVEEKQSYVELLDVLLFIFVTIAKKQIQKIAEIYLRFEMHESTWHELKLLEKHILKKSTSKINEPIQIDPFDTYALADTDLLEKYESHRGKGLSVQRSFKNIPQKLKQNEAIRRCSHETKFAVPITQEVITETIISHEKFLNELSRDKLWVRHVILSEDRLCRFYQFIGTLAELLILETSKGQLFSFTPDFYLLGLESLVTAGYLHIPVIVDMDTEIGRISRTALDQVVLLLATIMGDKRIVKDDCKDALDRIFATVIHSDIGSLSLEALPLASRMRLVNVLIKSYTVKRNVAANWILLRFWHGSGFAFRYTTIPNAIPSVNHWMHLNINFSIFNLVPKPSTVFQQSFLKVLQGNEAEAAHFVNNILNNMNWACSEWMNMLQDVKQAAIKREPVIVEPHTLHLIASCFDFTVAMLRVIEMTISLTSATIIKKDVQNNTVLISRLLQTVLLTISRVTDEKGCFKVFLDLNVPTADGIKAFPIVSALLSVFMATFKKDIDEFHLKGSNKSSQLVEVLYKECGDQFDALNNILHGNSYFQLVNNSNYSFDDISKDEQRRIILLVQLFQQHKLKLGVLELPDDEEICIICYSNAKDVYFTPCKHETCLICAKQLLMDTRNCFLCKAHISEVFMKNGEVIPELSDKVNEQLPLIDKDANLEYY